jgi:hypothetical protein
LHQRLVNVKQNSEQVDDEHVGSEETDDVEGEAEEMESGDAARARLARDGSPHRQMHLQKLEALRLAHGRCRERQGKEEDQKPPSPC